ncbi:MAG: electron transport complex, RnfABCDGE type, subunit [Betaproteobacteria bacterium]|nr:electron transport complex, RnfABCDGE type, subunit [Betaproteobacteria bacterium]
MARELAALLDVAYAPVDPRFGATRPPAVALIDEATCIGCTLCIEACPVDAIAGAAKLMHTVITSECTGCELCLAPCPVDCISLQPTGAQLTREARIAFAARSKRNYERRTERLARGLAEKRASGPRSNAGVDMEIVQQAIARARQRLGKRRQP